MRKFREVNFLPKVIQQASGGTGLGGQELRFQPSLPILLASPSLPVLVREEMCWGGGELGEGGECKWGQLTVIQGLEDRLFCTETVNTLEV